VLSTLDNFLEEYREHVEDKKCRSGVCKSLMIYIVDNDKCIGCTLCARNCPVNAITGDRKQAHYIDPEKCIKCGACIEKCKFSAIYIN
jgi:NADP-reducing hydrogenase subunit HndC